MKVWILQTGEPLHSDDLNLRPMRAINLANALIEKGHHVTLWSSSFSHQEKRHRTHSFSQIHINPLLTILLIPSKGYSSNICIDRVIDHVQLAFNLRKILKSNLHDLPDIAFIGYPPIEVASVMINWLKRRRVPTILDVKDLWPHVLLEAFPNVTRFVARVILDPYFRLAKQTILNAKVLTSMSISYLDCISDFAKRQRSTLDIVLPLVPRQEMIDASELNQAEQWWESIGLDLSHSNRIVFIGSLSQAFDFSHIRDAVGMLCDSGRSIEFVICGKGNDEEIIKKLFKGVPNVYFPGWINLQQASVLMKSALASIAPYKNTVNFTKNFPNKIVDSLSYGVPVITGLRGEVQRFIIENETGIFCEQNSVSWFKAFVMIHQDVVLRNKLSMNASMEYNRRFTFLAVYGSFVDRMEALAVV